MPAPALSPILAVDALRRLESAHSADPLMERAGAAAAHVARELVQGHGPVVVLAGPGNNGGDGFVVARLAHESFHEVVCVFPGDAERLPADAAAAYVRLRDAGLATVREPPKARPALIVDALFGIGLSRAPSPPYAALVEWANAQAVPVLALDIPTGLDAQTGVAHEPAIRASATATFIALKPGLLTHDGIDLAGRVSVHPLDLAEEVEALAQARMLAWPALSPALPAVLARRTCNVHKGSFGTLAIVGGDSGMVGAALLASRAAVRCGAGKVRVGFVGESFPAVDYAAPETMLRSAADVLAEPADALVVGCGLGMREGGRAALLQAIETDVPVVLDADALNLLSHDAWLRAAVRARNASTLATPHPAEAARLLGVETARVQRDRISAATKIARELDAAVVLKGAGSVLGYADGSFDINASGNPALATGGSGDVLAGVLGALLAQGIDGKTALRIGVCLHGAAADALVARGVGPLGVAASELADAARELLNRGARGEKRPS